MFIQAVINSYRGVLLKVVKYDYTILYQNRLNRTVPFRHFQLTTVWSILVIPS